MNTKVYYMRLGVLILLASALPIHAQQPKPSAPAAPPQAPAAAATPAAPPAAAAPAKPAVAPDKVVLKVGDQQTTAADMEFLIGNLPPQVQRMIASQGPRTVGEQYALMVALSQKAVSDHLNQDPDFARRQKLQEQQMLAQAEYKKMSGDIQVTPDEISQYFAAHKADFDEAEVHQVAVRIKPVGAAANAPGLPAAEARAKAEEIRKALAAGGDPAKLAENYKTPPGAIHIDTAPRTVNRASATDDAEKKVFDLKDGEISEIQENPQAVFFTQMIKRHDAQMSDSSAQIETKLREDKLQAAVESAKAASNIWFDPDFFAPPAGAPAAPPVAPPAAAPAAKPPVAPPAAKPPASPKSN